jgi:thiol-disulfide isomerase/thioredoxin
MVLEQPSFEGSFPVPEIDEEFYEEHIANKKQTARYMIYCYAPKHGTCKEVAPIISELAERFSQLNVI